MSDWWARTGSGDAPGPGQQGPGQQAQPSFTPPSHAWGPEPWQSAAPPQQHSAPQQHTPPTLLAPTPQKPTAQQATSGRTRGPGTGAVLALATFTALVVGGAAGFGGALLARPDSQVTAVAPTPTRATPGPSGSPAATTRPTPASRPGVPGDTVSVAQTVLPSTVTIAFRSGGRSGTGSGFVLNAEGHVMTNNHVVEGAANGGELQVELPDGERVPASIIGRSPSYDLAVIKVPASAKLVPVQLGESDGVRPGQPVVAVGAPLGLGGTVTAGIVSAVDRPLSVGGGQGADDAVAYINGIQTDASINPGNSGGPLADAAGRIIGVNSAILTLGGSSSANQGGNIGLGFAIPIKHAQVVGDQLVREGRATYPVIGASVQSADSGVRLSQVTGGGPADAAGLRTGDVVQSVDGHRVNTSTEMIVRIRSHRPGEQVRLQVEGRGEVSVTLGSKVG
ncbi:PDZ domain-containing protein [Naumannella sp. ID2617S]|nr:PDZ domain-containing protein [Naumannella sp. ID2617S]